MQRQRRQSGCKCRRSARLRRWVACRVFVALGKQEDTKPLRYISRLILYVLQLQLTPFKIRNNFALPHFLANIKQINSSRYSFLYKYKYIPTLLSPPPPTSSLISISLGFSNIFSNRDLSDARINNLSQLVGYKVVWYDDNDDELN